MKKSVKININLSNRWLYSILAVVIVILAGVVVWAYTDASGVGHDASQVGPGIFGVGYYIFPSGSEIGIGTDIPEGILHAKTPGDEGGHELFLETTQFRGAANILFRNREDNWSMGADSYPNIFSIGPYGATQTTFVIEIDGDVGIGTGTPGAKLDVEGEIRSTDSFGNSRLWGEGRPNVAVGNTAGECTTGGLKISKGNTAVSWDGVAAGCPLGWWVCTATERSTVSCGSQTAYPCYSCAGTEGDSNFYWVADRLPSPPPTGWPDGALGTQVSVATGDSSWLPICNTRRVWCCAYA